MKPWLKWTLWVVGGLLGVAILAIIVIVIYVNSNWDKPFVRAVAKMKAPSDRRTILRGEYLYKYSLGCWECHSPGLDAGALPSGGREFDLTKTGPGFGVFFAPNITPDKETGIGEWTDGEIVRSLREGLDRDGAVLFPIMPIEALRGLSDEDALAIVAYLRTLSPIRNEVNSHEYFFPAKALFAFGIIKPEAHIANPLVAPPKRDTIAYGGYVANNASLCMDCHTPRNLQDGSFYRDSLFTGSTVWFGDEEKNPLMKAYARNITPDLETGIGSWTEEQFFDALRAGMRPDGTVLSTHMPYAYYGLMDEFDLRALFLYLRRIQPIRRPTPPVWKSASYEQTQGLERGSSVFKASCEPCHGEEGKGAPPTSLSLAEMAPTVTDKTLADFTTGGNVGLRMPAFGKSLTPEQIKDVIAYIRSFEKKR